MTSTPTSVARSSEASGATLAVLSAYGLAVSAIPLPFLPDRLLARVRGAVVQDVAARSGLSLTSDARAALAAADSSQRTRFARAATSAVRLVLRRVPSLGTLTNITRGAEVYALGVLFDRYVRQVRRPGAVRIHVEEARRIREAIDRSLMRAFSPSLRPALKALGEGPDDLRDEFTRWIDAILLTTAVVPSYMERRLEAAFDEVVAEMPELHDG